MHPAVLAPTTVMGKQTGSSNMWQGQRAGTLGGEGGGRITKETKLK